jgi:hypothetical protein
MKKISSHLLYYESLVNVKYLLWTLLIFTGIIRCFLLGSGAVAVGDEYRYWYSSYSLLALSKGDFLGAIEPMFRDGARPGLVLIQMPSTILQAILYKLIGLDPRSTDSLIIPQVFNVVVSLLILWLLYFLCQKIGNFSKKQAFLLIFTYSLLASSTLYIRHTVPYQYALVLYFIAFWMIYTNKNTFWIGFISAFSFTVYPGYWPLVLLVLLLLWKERSYQLMSKEFLSDYFNLSLGAMLVYTFFEILSWTIGKSYFKLMFVASNGFLNDLKYPYDGSILLFVDYLWTLESMIGLILFCGGILYLIDIGLDIYKYKKTTTLSSLVLLLLSCLAIQTAIAFSIGLKAFYGRLFIQIIPFLLLSNFVLWFKYSQNIKKINKIIIYSVWVFTFMLNYTKFYLSFSQIGYPRDLLTELGFTQYANDFDYDIIATEAKHEDKLNRLSEYQPISNYTQPPNGFIKHPKNYIDSSYLFLNFSDFMRPECDSFKVFSNVNSYTWVVKRKHYLAYEPYWFDCYLDKRRAMFKKTGFWVGVLKPI